jgi:hypothetical protein
VAERFADGRASAAELAVAHAEARAAYRRLLGASAREVYDPETLTKVLTVCDALVQATAPLVAAHPLAAATVRVLLSHPGDTHWLDRLRRTQSNLLRDIFGNPFRRVKVDPAWRRAHPSVVAVAAGIYAGRNFDELPVLADALLDADCPSPAMVLHCHAPIEHGRGCWVVDLLRQADKG